MNVNERVRNEQEGDIDKEVKSDSIKRERINEMGKSR